MIETAQRQIAALEKKVGPDAKSPLFAQLASYYLEVNRAQDALRVCDTGLANYPFYTTGHLVKGKALASLNMRAEARREFEFVFNILPNSETLKKLLAEMQPGEEESIIQPAKKTPQAVPVSQPEVSQVHAAEESSKSLGGNEPTAPEQTPFAAPSDGSSFFDTITQAQLAGTSDNAFGFDTQTVQTPVEPESSPFSGFNLPTPSFSEKEVSPTEQSRGFDFTLPASDLNIPGQMLEEEPFEQYAARRRGELSGENTLSIEEYFSPSVDIQLPAQILPTEPESLSLSEPAPSVIPEINIFSEPLPIPPVSANVQDKIEELANKLQGAGKITPVINFAQKENPTASEQDTPAGMGFVTPTLAEIYAKQGWFDDAIKAYKTLARNKPAEKERFEKRILELEEQKKQSGV